MLPDSGVNNKHKETHLDKDRHDGEEALSAEYESLMKHAEASHAKAALAMSSLPVKLP